MAGHVQRAVRLSLYRMRSDESGFALIEIIVSMVITLIVMSALLGVFVSSLSTISLAKQRQSATALATQVMEQLRALPYNTVTASTTSTAPTGDPNVEYVSPAKFKPVGIAGVNEKLVVNTVSPTFRTQSLDGVTYTVRQYVSEAPTPVGGSQRSFSLTAIISWTSNASNGIKTTVERSAVYSPTGCLSTVTRPFSGPCQAYYTAQAGHSTAGISVTPTDESLGAIPGFAGNRIELVLPLLSSNLLLEQTTTARTRAVTTEGLANGVSAGGVSGGVEASAIVDSDPSSAGGQQQAPATAAQTATPKTLTGSAGTLRVTPSSGDSGVARAAVAANGTLCAGADANSTPLNTGSPGRPCASGQVQAGGTAARLVYEPDPSYGLLPMTLATVGPATSRAAAAHLTAANSGAGACGSAGVGCAHAAARRSLDDVVIGALPTSGAPVGYVGAWKVTALAEAALAERGPGTTTPTYTRSGAFSYWNGTGYTPVPLTAATQQDITPSPVTVAYTAPSGAALQLTVSSTVSVQAAVASTSGPPNCDTAACLAQTGTGGIRGQTTYTVTLGGAVQTSFVVLTNLAGLTAESSYKAAPSA